MNSELTKKALELVGNPSTLVNLMSRRVRQLTTGGGGMSRPLVEPPVGAGVADIALLEIIEGKITFESTQEEAAPEAVEASAGKPAPKRRRKTAAA